MINLFTRSQYNPILKPDHENEWECLKVYNPGAIYDNNQYHLYYRAMNEGENWHSSIGYAISADGENFQRFDNPILITENESEKRGLEDPRISKVGDTYYMSYAAYDGNDVRLNIATSTDLKNWIKRGPALNNFKFLRDGGVFIKWIDNKPADKTNICLNKEWSKSGAIFPKKITGKYWLLFGEYRLWLASSNDGIHYDVLPGLFLEPRRGDFFDNTFVEMGPPPIKTKNGWLVIYHGVDEKHTYSLGFLLLDLEDPRKILFRSSKPIFEPEEDYEIKGMVDILPSGLDSLQKMKKEERDAFIAEAFRNNLIPKVIFCCGATLVGKQLRIYYGAADSVICTAFAKLSDVLRLIK